MQTKMLGKMSQNVTKCGKPLDVCHKGTYNVHRVALYDDVKRGVILMMQNPAVRDVAQLKAEAQALVEKVAQLENPADVRMLAVAIKGMLLALETRQEVEA